MLEAKLCWVHFRSLESDLYSFWNKPYRTSGSGSGLASHLLHPHKPTHPLSLLDLYFTNIKYF